MNAAKKTVSPARIVLLLALLNLNQSYAQQLYVMTTQGGNFSGTCNNDVPQCGLGLIAKYDCSTSTITPKFLFTDSTGYIPDGFLMLASDGNLYGMTTAGGLNALSPHDSITSGGIGIGGTLFRYNPRNNEFTVLENFDAYAVPSGAVVQGGDGNLYGLTNSDGTNGGGTLFQYNLSTDTFTVMVNLPDSAWPGGAMIMASDSNLYGLTSNNGANHGGTLFQYNYRTNTYTVKKNLPQYAWPDGTLVEASDSNLYGLTYADGPYHSGTLFQYNYRTDSLTVKTSLPLNANPYGGTVMQANDGNLYGLTYGDGAHHSGTLFQYNYHTNTYAVKYNLPQNAKPWGSLMQASDNYIYGLTQFAGTNNDGTLFQYDYYADTFSVKINFDGTNGAFPIYNRLVEVDENSTRIKDQNPLNSIVTVYPNPSAGSFTLGVNSPVNQSAVIRITDLLGETVLEQKADFNAGNNTIWFNLTNRAKEIYFLSVEAGNGVVTKKIVIGE